MLLKHCRIPYQSSIPVSVLLKHCRIPYQSNIPVYCCTAVDNKGRFTHSMPCPCRAHSDPLPCRAAKGLECISHLIYTVRPCLIHTCHAMPMHCFDHAVLLKTTAQHGRGETAVLCCGLEKNGMVTAWHGHGMASVNQTRPHCVNQMGKTHSKPLAARHGRGTAWSRHGNGMLCVNRS